MNKKTLDALKSKSLKDLQEDVKKKKLEKARIYAEYKAGKDVAIKDMRNLKLDIAQILTIIREKEITEKLENQIKKQ